MATDKAVAAVSATIRGLLEESASGAEFAGVRFTVYQAKDLQAPEPEVVSIYLYRVSFNTTGRHLPPGIAPTGRRQAPPLGLDLHYLVTAWESDPLKQQTLLGWAARTLEDNPILPASMLNRYSAVPGTFGENESVELVGEGLSLREETGIWKVAQANRQPSLGYVARKVEIESRRTPAS